MKFARKLELSLITVISVLGVIIIINLFRKLRTVLPWRVNCWFCNQNFWVKLPQCNSWTCPQCEQYNGFTKDGDYNKPIFHTSDNSHKSPKVFKKSAPKNGLCKMCNVNQQLMVTQLANFVPMNDRRFDEEIEAYRLQLEKAYKLCSPCRKVLQTKLHKEKETLLGSKLLQSRTPEKKSLKKDKSNMFIKNIINQISTVGVITLFILASIELIINLRNDENARVTVNNVKLIIETLSERLYSIIKTKTLMTFPSISIYAEDFSNVLDINFDIVHKLTDYLYLKNIDQLIELTQEVIGGCICLMQIAGYLMSGYSLRHSLANDLLYTVFVLLCITQHNLFINPIVFSLVKLTCILAAMIINKKMRSTATSSVNNNSPPKKIKNLAKSMSSMMEDEDTSALETDDDVSLCKFGLHNFTDSSNENVLGNSTLNSGRVFSPHSQSSIWSKPKLNSTFCVNSMTSKIPSSVSETVFVKPCKTSFHKYQKLTKDDSDSDLDESISSLCISSPKKPKRRENSMFSLRKFVASPSFVAPSVSVDRGRPLISPSKLGHGTSWVAGGYWGSESEREFNLNGSRSSSQSSGFESQASSMTQRNAFSQPPSREESDCGELERASVLLDRFQGCNMSNYNYQVGRVRSPVFPPLQFNGHVHIPAPVQMSQGPGAFRAPSTSNIIKLPLSNAFPR